MRPIVRAAFLRQCRADYPVDLANGEDLSFYLQLVFDPSEPCILRVAEPLYYYREGDSTREPNASGDTFDLLTSYAIDRSGSSELDRWARIAAPGRRYIDRRFRRIMRQQGRLEGEVGGRPTTDADVSAARGWLLLIRRYGLKTASRIVDRSYRDAIASDLAAQLDR